MKAKLTKEDEAWAAKVKLRDKECVVCGETKRLNAHHILPRQLTEHRTDMMNGIALCPKHHRFSWELSAHQNPMAFFFWMYNNRPKQFAYIINQIKIPKS